MGLTPNILNETFDSITAWADGDTDTGVSEIDPAGQLRLDTNLGAAGNAMSSRYRGLISPPSKFTVEIKVKCDLVGAYANTDYLRFNYNTATWTFMFMLCSDGLMVRKTGAGVTEVGVNIVTTGGGATTQTFRFQVDKSAGEASAVVETFLEGVSQGTVDCDYELATTNGLMRFNLYGYTTDNIVSHIDYIRIATGLGEINDTDNPQVLIF